MAIFITWIYYSAIIIYTGAEFTKAWANELGGKIFPDEYAVATKVIEIREEKQTCQLTSSTSFSSIYYLSETGDRQTCSLSSGISRECINLALILTFFYLVSHTYHFSQFLSLPT